MSDTDAYASFEAKWFEAHPEIAVASIFLDAEQRRAANAFGSLAHEIAEAALHIREPRVAAAKLGWWRGELESAAAGQTRHPVTRRLFAEPRARALGAAPWLDLVDSAYAVADLPAAPDGAALLRQHRPFAAAVARIEALLAYGEASAEAIDNNAALWTIHHLVRSLPRLDLDAEALPVPLDLLARHGMTRGDLATAEPQRAALLRDHLDALGALLRERLAAPLPRTLYQRVRAARAGALIGAARGSPEPLQRLRHDATAGRWSNLWLSWREARRLARGA